MAKDSACYSSPARQTRASSSSSPSARDRVTRASLAASAAELAIAASIESVPEASVPVAASAAAAAASVRESPESMEIERVQEEGLIYPPRPPLLDITSSSQYLHSLCAEDSNRSCQTRHPKSTGNEARSRAPCTTRARRK